MNIYAYKCRYCHRHTCPVKKKYKNVVRDIKDALLDTKSLDADINIFCGQYVHKRSYPVSSNAECVSSDIPCYIIDRTFVDRCALCKERCSNRKNYEEAIDIVKEKISDIPSRGFILLKIMCNNLENN